LSDASILVIAKKTILFIVSIIQWSFKQRLNIAISFPKNSQDTVFPNLRYQVSLPGGDRESDDCETLVNISTVQYYDKIPEKSWKPEKFMLRLMPDSL
jgi:hypothetical protein